MNSPELIWLDNKHPVEVVERDLVEYMATETVRVKGKDEKRTFMVRFTATKVKPA